MSPSAYYAWRDEPDGASSAEQADTELLAEIRAIHDAFDGTYGQPTGSGSGSRLTSPATNAPPFPGLMTAELRRRGWVVNHKCVERLMREHGVVGHRPRPTPVVDRAGRRPPAAGGGDRPDR
ncbi:MAG: IS3 family transposase [Actinobacteria bacterium]|nr:IS3 family transposase [Actinomycetota bacterium]